MALRTELHPGTLLEVGEEGTLCWGWVGRGDPLLGLGGKGSLHRE